jgi:putative ABC transport system substrate-binding protein
VGVRLSCLALAIAGLAVPDVALGASKTIYLALWRGCEEACQGFKEAIAASGIDAEFIERNADQDSGRLQGFVEEARALDVDLVLAWGTTVTLGMVGKIADAGDPAFLSEIPVVYMIVADAVAAGIIESFEATGRPNVTGTHNRVPEETNIAAMRAFVPDLQQIGMLFSSAENNSTTKVEEVRELTQQLGLQLIAVELDLGTDGAPIAGTIPEKLAQLKDEGADFLYVGSSSFLERNGGLLARAALPAGIPVLSPYERLVTEEQALVSVAARYDAIGRLAARQAAKILTEGIAAGDLPVLRMEQFAFVINMNTARSLDLFPPLELLQIAETVE